MRAKGKSTISGSQKRLKRNGSIAPGVSGPPSWNRTAPTRRVGFAIPRVSLKKEDVTQNLYAASTWRWRRVEYFGARKNRTRVWGGHSCWSAAFDFHMREPRYAGLSREGKFPKSKATSKPTSKAVGQECPPHTARSRQRE